MAHSPGAGMNKGLPTFRAGGSTARNDLGTRRVDDGINHKSALKTSFFSHDHFSSSLAKSEDPMMKRTRVVVKVIEGKDLLVSDLPTGTSDPMAFVWVGSNEEGDLDLHKDQRVQTTEVKKHTVDPVWDAEFVFPLEVESVEDVMEGEVKIIVRDYDDADGDVHYFDLGRASISLDSVLTEGNVMSHTQLVQLSAKWFPLQRCRGMRKVRGALKIAVGFFLGSDSNLLQNVDEGNGVEKPVMDKETQFETKLNKIRGVQVTRGGQTMSLSPARRRNASNRNLTARGGTVGQRPKSAQGATHLSSPTRGLQQPFELKPLQAKFPRSTDVESTSTANDPPSSKLIIDDSSGARANATNPPDTKPRWRDTYGSPQRRSPRFSPPPRGAGVDATAVGVAPPPILRKNGNCHLVDSAPTKWEVDDPQIGPVRSSTKLSRLAAKSASRNANQGELRNVVGSTPNDEEGPVLKAHRWYRRLLVSIQRLECRSTERMAYGELRAMVRGATATQTAQIVTATRDLGATCSLSTRRYTIKLLSWLCWDQPRAATKVYPGIIAYVLERVQDPESVSLRADLSACVGAVMLSALRNGTATACMLQTQRFLELVREQRATVRESAGVCCVAAVLPPSPPIPLEVDTGMRSIEDVRFAIGRGAGRIGTMSVVPKEGVLLPGGRAVIELADMSAAAAFYEELSAASGGLPATWRILPFPESACDEAGRARIAHAARLTVNSEEILASLLGALDTSRSEGTRAPLLDTIAAMARSCATFEKEFAAMSADGAAVTDHQGGLSATLKKGLPAIVRVIFTILECPIRRAYTWRERVATLEAIISLSILPALFESQGPLGEYRLRLIQGCVRGKHDSVPAVREVAVRALLALEATKTEMSHNRSCVIGSWESLGSCAMGKDAGLSMAEMRRSYHARERGIPKKKPREKTKLLDVLVNREVLGKGKENEASEEKRAVEDSCSTKQREDGEHQRPKLERDERIIKTPVAPSVEGALEHRGKSMDETKNKAQLVTRQESAWPFAVETRDDTYEKEALRRTSSVPSSPAKCELPHNSPPERSIERETRYTQLDPNMERKTDDRIATTSLEPTNAKNDCILAITLGRESLQHVTLPTTAIALAKSAHQESDGDLNPIVPARTEIPLSPPPRDGGIQVDTVRLLRDLNDKSDGIAISLGTLDQRLVGMEKSLVERLPVTASPTRVLSRKLKRPRSSRAQHTDGGHRTRTHSSPGHISPPPIAAAAATPTASSVARHKRLQQELGQLVEHGDIEGAFRLALMSGTERDVLRLMRSAGGPGACRHRLGMETRDLLFAFLARVISARQYSEHALPWIFEIVQAGEARSLPLAVRMQVAGSLHGLAASPTDQGVLAARLGPHLSLTVLGRTSMSDDADGGNLLRVLVAGGG